MSAPRKRSFVVTIFAVNCFHFATVKKQLKFEFERQNFDMPYVIDYHVSTPRNVKWHLGSIDCLLRGTLVGSGQGSIRSLGNAMSKNRYEFQTLRAVERIRCLHSPRKIDRVPHFLDQNRWVKCRRCVHDTISNRI